ncbi:uncharacterized protein [Ptychodera flava]
MKNIWCSKICRQDGRDGFKVTKSTVICHKHFKKEDIAVSLGAKIWKLKPGAVPESVLSEGKSVGRKKPRQRITAEEKPKAVRRLHFEHSTDRKIFFRDASVQTDTQDIKPHPPHIEDHSYSFTKPSYLDTIDLCKEYILCLEKKLSECTTEIQMLKCKLGHMQIELDEFKNRKFCVDNFKDDDAIQFYTGFQNYASFYAFFHYLEPKAKKLQYWKGERQMKASMPYQDHSKSKPGPKRKLSLLDEFFMVLVRCKVGLFVKDLADRFGISPSAVSKIFTTWIIFLSHELLLLFPFPSQFSVRKNIPDAYELYPTTRVIIDCTEFFIEVPSSMLAQSQTWSSYKHHNTWKVLVGISPNGQVIFVSDLWGGRVSDYRITRDCGILEKLDEGDNIMADRGFEIRDILPPGITLNIPPFKGDRAQLSSKEVSDTINIASVRIHVERAIGRIKNYHILNGVIPLSLKHIINELVIVCSYLTNFLPPLLLPKSIAPKQI